MTPEELLLYVLIKTAEKNKKKKKMPHFTEQNRSERVKRVYRALKREHPEMPAEVKARIASKFGPEGVQHQGPPYKGDIHYRYVKGRYEKVSSQQKEINDLIWHLLYIREQKKHASLLADSLELLKK